MTNLIVGIDLGTTNSLIGAVVDGAVRLFADASGAELLPSVVGAPKGGGVLVGRPARNLRLVDPEGTVSSIKRSMGRDVRVRVGERELSPPQVSALILSALLDRAEAALGGRPARAVITVPAYFDEAQRQATKDAGQIAGLAVERLVNEPTAAALTYQAGAEQRVLVYDLGGGTFDVSVLERDEGFLEVKASHGDTHLGGDDIDRALLEHVLEQLGAGRPVVERDRRAMTRLLEAVERAKIALSARDEVRLFDPFVAGEGAAAVHLDLPLRRETLEQIARPFVARTLACVDRALRDAGLGPEALDRVLLVGGSSKMPLVRAMVSEHLGRPAQVDLDADRAVALGASLLAARIAGAEIDEVLVDITPHTLAAGAVGRAEFEDDVEFEDDDDDPSAPMALVAVPIVPRGTVVPVERKRTVYTRFDDQPAAEVPIVQGEEALAEDNTQLGVVRIEDLPPGPACSPIEVAFRLDLSGVLHVSATHLPSGKRAEVHIAKSPYQLTEHQRRRAREEIEDLRASGPGGPSDEGAGEGEREGEGARVAPAGDVHLARAMLGRAGRALAQANEREGTDPDAVAKVRAAVEALERAVATGDAAMADRIDALSDALLDLV
ncbi:MAG TPA: Hsp70 family protein [Polyangiaceae bacterium]|nr:Hsp70 family protein [Polyangiaceae bacterium]